MRRLAFGCGLLIGGFIAGAAAMLSLVDRLLGGRGRPDVEVDELARSWGDQ